MLHTWLALAVLCSGAARGAGPTYSADGIVNVNNYQTGPFAPNSVLSIFGTGLARSEHVLAQSDLTACASSPGRCLPLEMNYVRVYVQDQPAPMLYVSAVQINFLMPGVQIPGPVRVRVVVEGVTGPEVTVTLVDVAPALFSNPMPGGYVIATSADGKLLTADNAAHAYDTVVVYATGLGYTSPNPPLGVIPASIAQMTALVSLKISLNGVALDHKVIAYAGVTPGSAGLYQINIVLPDGTGPDPEIRVWAGDLPAQTGLRLALR